MSDAIIYIKYIYTKFLNFLFNGAFIENGVSIGWILVSVFLFILTIRSIINVPVSVPRREDKDNG